MHYLCQKEILGNCTVKGFPSLLLTFLQKGLCLLYQSLNTKYLMNLKLHLPLAAGRNRLSKVFWSLWGWMLGLDHLLLLQPPCFCFRKGFLVFHTVPQGYLGYPELSFSNESLLLLMISFSVCFFFPLVEWDLLTYCSFGLGVWLKKRITNFKKKGNFHSAAVCSQIEFSLGLGIQPYWFTVGY